MNTNTKSINNLIMTTTTAAIATIAISIVGNSNLASRIDYSYDLVREEGEEPGTSNIKIHIAFPERKSYSHQLNKFANSDWFRKTYYGKSLGDAVSTEE